MYHEAFDAAGSLEYMVLLLGLNLSEPEHNRSKMEYPCCLFRCTGCCVEGNIHACGRAWYDASVTSWKLMVLH
uniref:Uncharacterized protein n=1 Tax=Setaria viridis TaxID=4556 RepID=A0A4U6TFL5_SETVI|nr:hypothetical protein SEVIR_8G103300v2 [Setaria viridis]